MKRNQTITLFVGVGRGGSRQVWSCSRAHTTGMTHFLEYQEYFLGVKAAGV